MKKLDKFWFKGAWGKMEWGMSVDLPLVWGEFWCPNFAQVFDYSIFKAVEHCLKPFFHTNKRLIAKGKV